MSVPVCVLQLLSVVSCRPACSVVVATLGRAGRRGGVGEGDVPVLQPPFFSSVCRSLNCAKINAWTPKGMGRPLFSITEWMQNRRNGQHRTRDRSNAVVYACVYNLHPFPLPASVIIWYALSSSQPNYSSSPAPIFIPDLSSLLPACMMPHKIWREGLNIHEMK